MKPIVFRLSPWRWWLTGAPFVFFFVALMLAWPKNVLAADGPIQIYPETIAITGTLPDGNFATTLRLTALEAVSGLQLLATDLQDATGDGRLRDPIPSTSVEFLPMTNFDTLSADTLLQIVVRVNNPPAAGEYMGTVTLRWAEPSLNQLDLPFHVTVRAQPTLELQDSTGVALVGRYSRHVNRQLLLRAGPDGSALTDLHITSLDLIKNTTNYPLPREKIVASIAAASVAPGSLVTTTLDLDTRGVPAGEYMGNLIIAGAPNFFLSIPVTVKVADYWLLPLLVVTAGVVLGLWLTHYTQSGKIRDEFVLRLDRLRDALRNDSDLLDDDPVWPLPKEKMIGYENPQHGFAQTLQRLITESDGAVRSAEWETATSKIAPANQLLLKWRANRVNWIKQIAHLRTIVAPKIFELRTIGNRFDTTPIPVQRLIRKVELAIATADTYEDPRALQRESDRIIELLGIYQSLYDQLYRLDQLLHAVGRGANTMEMQPYLTQLATLQQAFAQLHIDDDAALDAFQQQVSAFAASVPQPAPDAGPLPEAAAQSRSMEMGVAPDIYIMPPELLPSEAYDPIAAQQRLTVYWVAAYFLASFLLAMVGLSTIYLANDTFGANPLMDYLSLFLFGLGAETTVTSTAGLLSRLGIQSPNAY